MKKQLLTVSLLTAFAGMAQAQSNVTIYGIVDTGYIKETGSDLKMGSWNDSRIGFKGTEDLGSGYKATFQLERRFNPNDGAATTDIDWEGASNVGLAGPFGAVRFGRMNEIETESFRRLDPFNQEGVGSMLKGTQRTSRISNVARYDSPSFSGFKVALGYYLGENTDRDSAPETHEPGAIAEQGANNDGYAIGLNYDNGSLLLLANYSRLSDSNDSYVWSIGGAYKIDGFKVGLGFERTDDRGWKLGNYRPRNESKQNNWILSAEYKTGPHKIAGSFSWIDFDNLDEAQYGKDSLDAKKYSVGYFYSLSKRTTLYGQLAYTDFEDKTLAENVFGYYDDDVTGVQIGINHKF